jgi:Flp pilus assembly protein TadD
MKSKSGLLAALALLLVACARPAMLPPKAIELNREGAAALADGNLELAQARIALAIEYNPRFTEAWVNLGIIEMQRGNFAKARKHFVKARDLNPGPWPHPYEKLR